MLALRPTLLLAGQLLLCWITAACLQAQTGSLFDLTPRLDSARSEVLVQPAAPSVQAQDVSQRNPFDIINRHAEGDSSAFTPAQPAIVAADSNTPSSSEPAVNSGGPFNALLGLGLLVLMSVLFVAQGSALRRMSGAALNANLLGRLVREQRQGGYFLWAFIGCLSIGSFLFAGLRALEVLPAGAAWTTLDWFVLGTIGAVVIKLLILTLLRWVFPIARAVDPYRALIIVWISLLGVAVFPLTILVLFAGVNVAVAASYLGGAILLLGLALMSLRALLESIRFVLGYPIHFLMYFCALEIGPLAVAYNLLMG